MKLSPQTIALLKNFAAINGNVYIPVGNTVKTMTVVGNMLASAVIEEEFDKPVSVYDLGEFLSVLAIAPDGDVILSDEFLTVKWGKSKVRYSYADRNIMRDAIAASEKDVKFPAADVEFVLTPEMLGNIHKASSILKAGFVVVFNDEGKVSLKVFDKSLVNGNVYVVETGVETDLTFEAIFDVANLKLMTGEYQVSISKRGVSRFVNTEQDLKYYITLDIASKFN